MIVSHHHVVTMCIGASEVCGFRLPFGVKCLGKRDMYLLRGIALTSALQLTLWGGFTVLFGG